MNSMARKTAKSGKNEPGRTISGIIFDIKRYAIHDGPGIRTTIFFKGCPLRCWWCHNPEGLRPGIETISPGDGEKSRKEPRLVGEKRTVQSVMKEITRDVVFFDESGGGVTFSGGEPLMQPGFLRALLAGCGREGIHRVVDTCGYAPPDALASVVDLVDLFLYDLKFVDPALHRKYTGKDNRFILSNLREIHRRSRKTVIRFPVVPGVTDSRENISRISRFLSPLENIRDIDLLPFHSLAAGKYRRLNIRNRLDPAPEPVSREALDEITGFFRSRGFRVNRGGNHE